MDCLCGVTFDDGEEMVDCDECGVWVHTSCCRILKGHTSYVCDKCKKKKKESDESEVAQLLVELPSKTPAFAEKMMDKAELYSFPSSADLSMEERAHIHGIPGGDAGLFVGVSPVFSRQLWKYTGYVPKMLRFDYHEVPEWSGDRVDTSSFLVDAADQKLDNLALASLSKEQVNKPEEQKPLESEVEGQTEHNQSSKDKYGRRELRKESSYRQRAHVLKEEKSHQHSKRRRDMSGKKDTASKKRARNAVDGYQGFEETAKKASEEAVVSLRSSRSAPKNPKAIRKLAARTYMDAVDGVMKIGNDCSKVDMLTHDSDSLVAEPGYAKAETMHGHECLKPLDCSTNSSRDNLAGDGNDEREDWTGVLHTPPSFRSTAQPTHHEIQHDHKEAEGLVHPKAVNNTNQAGVDVDCFPRKHHSSDAVDTDINSRLGDSKDVQRLRGSIENTKQNLEEVVDDQSAANGKYFQEHLSTSPEQHFMQGSSIQPPKYLANEETAISLKQQNLVQKQLASTEMHSPHHLHSVKYAEQTRSKAVKSTHQRHNSIRDASHSLDDEQTDSYNQSTEQYGENSLHDRADEQMSTQDEHIMHGKAHKAKGQEQEVATPSSPSQQIVHQEADTVSKISTSAAGRLHLIIDESPNTSPLSTQTAPLRSSNLNSSSPTSSCPGISSKQQGFMKSKSVSPTFEKTSNAVLAQPLPTSKQIPGISGVSSDKDYTSKVGIAPTNSSLKNSSSTKHRPRTHSTPDTKKANVGNTATKSAFTSTAEAHASEPGISSSRHSSKDPTKLGKGSPVPPLAKLPLNAKAHTLLASTRQSGKPSSKQGSGLLEATPEQSSLSQLKPPVKPVSISMSHKAEKSGIMSGSSSAKASTVLPPPHPTGPPDRQLVGTNFAPPTLNDEELALLLHQELNSSPRVSRVARIRQGATAPQHLSVAQTSYHSTKRPTGVTVPTACSASQKEHHLVSRRRMRDDSCRESSRGADDLSKTETLGTKKQDDPLMHVGSRKDGADGCSTQKPSTLPTAELSSHLSPGPGNVEGQSASDVSGANELNDGDRKGLSDNVLTLPGLIEEILNEKGHQASYDYICEEVLPHWPKLRKHNGERYAYTSHRQAVLDCLRNRTAWSHLIDRGPKTNVGRKRRRPESIAAVESENAEDVDVRGVIHDDGGEDLKSGKSPKEVDMDGSDCWPPSDGGKDIDLTLPEEVPKGKRKARQRRRLAVQAKGYGTRNRHGNEEKVAEALTMSEEDHERVLSPLSEDATSNYSEEEEEMLVHCGGRHTSRHRGSSVDSGDDEMEL